MSLNLKLIKGTEMRKVSEPPQDIAGLNALITSLFGITDFVIRYIDEEGDTITLATDLELQMTYSDAEKLGLLSFKFYIEQKTSSEAVSEPVRKPMDNWKAVRQQAIEAQPTSLQQMGESLHPHENLMQVHQALKAFKRHSKASKELKHQKSFKPMKLQRLIRALIHKEANAHLGHEASPSQVWPGVSCDGCEEFPMVGLRYKCAVCDNFDFCESCERSLNHPHPFIKLKTPNNSFINVTSEISRSEFRNFKKLITGKRPKARFVGHVNFKEGDTVIAGQTFSKLWRVKNVGLEAWPVGTILVYCRGDLTGVASEVPSLAPGEEAEIGAELKVPEEAGSYYSVWRLSNSCGQRFGEKLHVLVNAEVSEDLSGEFMEKLKIMEDMGFIDREQNKKTLEVTGGDVDLAISRLVNP